MKKQRNGVQAVWYVFWSVMTTLVNWVTYTVCVTAIGGVWQAELTTLVAGVIAWVVAVTFSFAVNKWLVFCSENRSLRVLVREVLTFFSTRLLVGTLEIVLPPLIVMLGWDVPLLGVDGLLSKCLITPILIALNYLCGKFLVFRKACDKEESA